MKAAGRAGEAVPNDTMNANRMMDARRTFRIPPFPRHLKIERSPFVGLVASTPTQNREISLVRIEQNANFVAQ